MVVMQSVQMKLICRVIIIQQIWYVLNVARSLRIDQRYTAHHILVCFNKCVLDRPVTSMEKILLDSSVAFAAHMQFIFALVRLISAILATATILDLQK